MQKFMDAVLDREGRPVKGASVLVTSATGANVPIYSDNMHTPMDNPIITDANGMFEFYGEDGRYNLTISGIGINTLYKRDILLRDSSSLSLGAKSVTLSMLADDVVAKLGTGITPPPATLDATAILCFGGNLFYGADGAAADPQHTLLASSVPTVMDTAITSHTVQNEGAWWANTSTILLGTDALHPALQTYLATATAKYFLFSSCMEDAYAPVTITVAQYQANLEQIADMVTAKGMTCIFVTPNKTDDGAPDAYRMAMLAVANTKTIPVIDVYTYHSTYLGAASIYTTNSAAPYGYLVNQAMATLIGQFMAEEFAKIAPATVDVGGGVVIPPPDTGVRPYGRPSSEFGQLIFQDEFNSNALDTTRWSQHIWYSDSGKRSFSVSNGTLNIWPETPFGTATDYVTLTTDPASNLGLSNPFSFTYGYAEMSAKLPKGLGVWPAFWLYNHDDPLHEREIDIMESYGTDGGASDGFSDNGWTTAAEPGVLQNYTGITHKNNKGISYQDSDTMWLSKTIGNYAIDLSLAFHKYACKWEPAKIEFFFDGQSIGSVPNDGFFNLPMFLLLDLWQGGAAGMMNTSTPTGYANSYMVDYVRVWELSSGVPTVIAVYGDSTVKGYNGTTTVATPWPSALATSLGVTVFNEGVNSTTATQLLNGTDGVHQAWDYELARRPSVNTVMICHGINSTGETDAIFKASLTSLVTKAKAAGKKVILLTPNPVNFISTAYNARIQAILAVGREQAVQVIDVFAYLLFDYGNAMWPEANVATRISSLCADVPAVHPSQATYTVMADFIKTRYGYNDAEAKWRVSSPDVASMFAPTSVWYKDISAAPLNANSSVRMVNFEAQRATWSGNVSINTYSFTSPLYVADTTKSIDIAFWDATNKGYDDPTFAAMRQDVPIPALAQPAKGGDSELAVYNPATGDLYEYWLSHRTSPVVNCFFNNNLTGWTATNATQAVASGELTVTATSANGYSYQNITLESGKEYWVRADLKCGTTAGVKVELRRGAAGGYALLATSELITNPDWDAVQFDVPALQATDAQIRLICTTAGTGVFDVPIVSPKSGDNWETCWGGKLNAKTADTFVAPYGASASGIPYIAGQVTAEELASGVINHSIGISIMTLADWDVISWPANRSDGGGGKAASAIPMGARFRLKAATDISGLNPVAKTIAVAAKKYGFIVVDTSGSLTIRARNPVTYQQTIGIDPYPAIYNGMAEWQVLSYFPWDQCEFIVDDWGKP